MKAINKTKVITLGLMSFFIIGFSQPSWSYDTGKSPIEFAAIGNLNHSPLFEFKANNTEAAEYVIKVMDADGNLLYSEILKGKNVTRKYRIDMGDTDLNDGFRLRFEVTNVKAKETFVYNATRKSRVVEDIEVAKL
jgi:hypothetical protein